MLDRLAKPGLPLQVTELDVLTGDPDLQAAYLRDVLTVMYSHPAVEGVIMWGFWDGAHWKRTALLYARDWSEKPALKVWRELIFKQWWTDAKGRFAASGFVGEYEVTASRGGKTKTVKATLPAAGATVGVVLE